MEMPLRVVIVALITFIGCASPVSARGIWGNPESDALSGTSKITTKETVSISATSGIDSSVKGPAGQLGGQGVSNYHYGDLEGLMVANLDVRLKTAAKTHKEAAVYRMLGTVIIPGVTVAYLYYAKPGNSETILGAAGLVCLFLNIFAISNDFDTAAALEGN